MDNYKDLDSTFVEEEYNYAKNLKKFLVKIKEDYLKQWDSINKQPLKFDFVIPALSYFSNMQSDSLKFIIENANSIILTSDGNAQQYSVYPTYVSAVNAYGPKTQEELSILFDNISNPNFSQYSNNDFKILANLKSKFKIFNIEGSYSNWSGYDIPDAARLEINSYSNNYHHFINTYFKDNLSDTNKITKLYETYFNIANKTNETIFALNHEKYDHSKKNVIFMGSSMFRKLPKDDTYVLDVVKAIFTSWLNQYPVDQYNWVFKLHPMYRLPSQSDSQNTENKKLDALEYLNWISGNKFQEPILIDPTIPWEILIAYDYAKQNENPKNVVKPWVPLFFDGNGNDIKSKLLTLQPSSTVFLSTGLYLTETYKQTQYNQEQKLEILNFNNNSIPSRIGLVNRKVYKNERTGKTENKAVMEKIYKPFIDTNTFPKFSYNETYEDYVLEMLGYDFRSKETTNILIISVISSLIALVFVCVVGSSIFKYKKNSNALVL